MATSQDTRAVARRNPTSQAIATLLRRGWHGRSALAHVCWLWNQGDLATIRQLARCESGSVSLPASLDDTALVRLAAALGIVPAKIRAALQDLAADDAGTAAQEYVLLALALALGGIGFLGAAEVMIEALWHQPPVETGPVLCAGPIRPTPTGGGC